METIRESDPALPPLGPIRTHIDRFKVIERLGAGGMGEVFVAFDPQLERQVALKLLKRSIDPNEEEVERMLKEARAMAKVSHPNVVSVFDAGIEEGQPWVAMELIRGTTLREWLGAPHAWPDAVRLLIQVGRGLEAAHQAGLVHRDLKPENVLVGADGRIAVTDFGIAQLGAATSTVVVGTRGYMAPELYLGRIIDARTDQFAFAVTAYESLWGVLPFSQAAELDANDPALTPALRAKGVPPRIWRALKRSLQPDAANRFPAMGELLTELALALPRRSFWPGAIAVGALIAAPLLWSVLRPAAANACAEGPARLEPAWGAARQEAIKAAFLATNAAYAGDAFRAAKADLDAYAGRWTSMYEETCRATRVEGRQSEALLDLRMACLDRRRSVMAALTDVWSKKMDLDTLQAATDATRGLASLDECADAKGLTERSPLPTDPAVVAKVKGARAQVDVVTALTLADQRKEARAAAEAARKEAASSGWPQVEAEAALAEGRILSAMEVKEAERALLDAARLGGAARDDRLAAGALIDLVHHLAMDQQSAARALLVADLADGVLLRGGDDARLRVQLLRFRGAALRVQGSYAEAHAAMDASGKLANSALGPTDWETRANLAELAVLAETEGNYAEARRLGEQVIAAATERFGADHPRVASLLNNLAIAVDRGGDPEASAAYHRRALAIKEKVLGPDSTSTATTLNNLGIVEMNQGHLDLAQPMLERALAIREKQLGPDHAYVATTLGNLAGVLRNRGDYAQSHALLERSLAIKTKNYGPSHVSVANSLAEIGSTYEAEGNDARAGEYYRRALEVRRTVLGPKHPQTVHSVNLVASSLVAMGKCNEARPMLSAPAPAADAGVADKPTRIDAEGLMLIAECELVASQWAAARDHFTEALAIREAVKSPPPDLGTANWGLGRAQWGLGEKKRAIEEVRQAQKHLTGQPAAARLLSEVNGWLARHAP